MKVPDGIITRMIIGDRKKVEDGLHEIAQNNQMLLRKYGESGDLPVLYVCTKQLLDVIEREMGPGGMKIAELMEPMIGTVCMRVPKEWEDRMQEGRETPDED